MNLPEFSVRNSIFANVLFWVVVIVGLIAAFNAKRDLFPATDLDIVVVSTVYPGALPEEVENHVTIPIEEQLRGVNGIDKYVSRSVESISSITINIDPDEKNKERVINNILRKVDRVRFQSDRIEEPDVEVITTREMTIEVCVGGNATEADVRAYADQLETKLARIKHVGSIWKTGWRDPEIWVEVDADKLIEQELSIFQIAEALRRQNINFPGGKIPEGSKEMVLRTTGEFSSIEDIKSVVVRSNEDGKSLTVADIANVRHALAEDQVILRANGSRAVMLWVEKKSVGDTIRIADAVKELIATEREHLPQGIELSVFDFESYMIKRRLKVLLSNGGCGLLLVLLALPLLMNFRVAVVTALGIPFAFLTAILVMSYFGISINMLTMFGMILVVGMLVDDAIIMAENIFRHMEAGESPRDAAIAGAREVMWPVTATVLTTIVAFLPLAFLPGIMGRFLKWIPIVVMITLGASLFEALLILPCHVAHLAKSLRKTSDSAVSRGGRGSQWSQNLQSRYESLLKRVLKHRAIFVVGILLCFVGSVFFAGIVMDVDMFPADLIDIFFVHLTMERGTCREATEDIVKQIEKKVATTIRTNELQNVLSEIGHIRDQHMSKFTRGSRYGMLTIYLTPAQGRERSAQTLIDELRAVCQGLPGVDKLAVEMIKPGPPAGKPVDVKLLGSDIDTLDAIAGEVRDFLEGMEGVQDAEDDYEIDKDELRLVPDKQEAARLGLDSETVARGIYSAFHGAEVTSIRNAKEETIVRVRLPDSQKTEKNLRRLRIPNRKGRLVELGKVTKATRQPGISGIAHYNGDRAVSVQANLSQGQNKPSMAGLSRGEKILRRLKAITTKSKGPKDRITVDSVNSAIKEKFKDLPDRYPGYSLIRGGEWETNAETKKSMLRAFAIALVMIYAILIVQFKSVFQPLTVVVAIPFGLIGVVLALFLHGKPVSMMAMMGMVGMTGVVVNDAIVLVSFVNDLRRGGMPAHEALVVGASRRLRPIILTSVTTVLGLAPVIYGLGGYEPFVAPAAIVLAYGLVFATFLTLLVVPCMYSLGIDLKIAISRRCVNGQDQSTG